MMQQRRQKLQHREQHPQQQTAEPNRQEEQLLKTGGQKKQPSTKEATEEEAPIGMEIRLQIFFKNVKNVTIINSTGNEEVTATMTIATSTKKTEDSNNNKKDNSANDQQKHRPQKKPQMPTPEADTPTSSSSAAASAHQQQEQQQLPLLSACSTASIFAAVAANFSPQFSSSMCSTVVQNQKWSRRAEEHQSTPTKFIAGLSTGSLLQLLGQQTAAEEEEEELPLLQQQEEECGEQQRFAFDHYTSMMTEPAAGENEQEDGGDEQQQEEHAAAAATAKCLNNLNTNSNIGQICYNHTPIRTKNVIANYLKRTKEQQEWQNNNNENDIDKAWANSQSSAEDEGEEAAGEEEKENCCLPKQVHKWRLSPLEVPKFSFKPRSQTAAPHVHATAELWGESTNTTDESNKQHQQLESHKEDVQQIRVLDKVNPWDELMRHHVLKAVAPVLMDCQNIPNEQCPAIAVDRIIQLGYVDHFRVERLLGQGGFAHVFLAHRAHQEHCCPVAIKYESPACAWEVFICRELKRRLVSDRFASYCLADIKTAYLYRDASAIIYEFYPHGCLLDLQNVYRVRGTEMGGLLATFFAFQMARVLQAVHTAGIIHADVKPDNVMLAVGDLDIHTPMAQLLERPALRLIDWGRAIDMSKFPEGQQFECRAGTQHFECPEMLNGKPWSYHTDFYGYVATIFVLLKGDYMKPGTRPADSLNKHMALYDLWADITDQLLNIPPSADNGSQQQPQQLWPPLLKRMEEALNNATAASAVNWTRALERFNDCMKQRHETEAGEGQQGRN